MVRRGSNKKGGEESCLNNECSDEYIEELEKGYDPKESIEIRREKLNKIICCYRKAIEESNLPDTKNFYIKKQEPHIKFLTSLNREYEEQQKLASLQPIVSGKPKNKKLCDCTVKELKERAKARKKNRIEGYSTMNKAELLAALRRK